MGRPAKKLTEGLSDIGPVETIKTKIVPHSIPEWQETPEEARFKEAVRGWPLNLRDRSPDAQLLDDYADDSDLRQIVADNLDDEAEMGSRILKYLKGKWKLATRPEQPSPDEIAAGIELDYQIDRMKEGL